MLELNESKNLNREVPVTNPIQSLEIIVHYGDLVQSEMKKKQPSPIMVAEYLKGMRNCVNNVRAFNKNNDQGSHRLKTIEGQINSALEFFKSKEYAENGLVNATIESIKVLANKEKENLK